MKLSAENQTQRVNSIITIVEGWQELELDLLNYKPAPNVWSILEIVGHMNQAYKDYEDKIETLLAKLPEEEGENEQFKMSWLPKTLVNSFKPKGQVIKWKMKTFNKFQPGWDANGLTNAQAHQVFGQFYAYNNHLKSAIFRGKNKAWNKGKLVSAIGPLVRFSLPECFEFLITHEERHLVQGKLLLEKHLVEVV